MIKSFDWLVNRWLTCCSEIVMKSSGLGREHLMHNNCMEYGIVLLYIVGWPDKNNRLSCESIGWKYAQESILLYYCRVLPIASL